MARPERTRLCQLCGEYEENDFHDHKETSIHSFNYILREYNKKRKKNCRDRNGIVVSSSLNVDENNNDNIEVERNAKPGYLIVKISPEKFEQIGRQLKFVYTIKNNSNLAFKVRLTILYPNTDYSIHPEDTQYVLHSGGHCQPTVKFKLDSTLIGSYKIPMVVTAEPYDQQKKKDYFNIFKDIIIYLRQWGPEDVMHEGSPFQGDKWDDNIIYICPLKMPKMTNFYPIPSDVYRIFMYNMDSFKHNTVAEIVRRDELRYLFEHGLRMDNYAEFFENLLWLDETSAILGLMNYNMTTVDLKLIRGEILELIVPGLAEKRPSIVQGDLVNLRLQGDHTAYQGVVTNINDNSIYISYVHKEFLKIIEDDPDYEVDVMFQFSRLQYDRMHKGINMCVQNGMLRSLFPSPYINPIRNPIRLTRNDLYSKSIATNAIQLTAVESILNNTSQTAPYIVFGPPGTGKTTTIVEAILQIKKNYPKKRILVCAPSNSACDMLCTKLSEHITDPKELLRIHSMTRSSTEIPSAIKKYSNIEGTEMVQIEFKLLKDYNIVVATLHLIGKFTGRYSPDCLFIDEAAQATEPECAIPIGLLVHGTEIILAGDPKQLGPICASQLAANFGLDVSLMDRLMNTNHLYQPRNPRGSDYDPEYLSMLKINYRSHRDIIDIPNQLFYSNSLRCLGPQNDLISCLFISMKVFRKTNMFVKQGCSVEFCGVLSKEDRKGHSPSYYNVAEIQMVLSYVRALCYNSECAVNQKDIGIIAPYIRQVHLIKKHLKEEAYHNVEVGTTESFQGREKRIMIISTVRAQHSLLKYDRKYNLGFVKHKRRFNVALTRAQSKLIIIGNPLCLNYDKACWSKLIEFCEDRQAYFGYKNIERTREIQNNIQGKFALAKV